MGCGFEMLRGSNRSTSHEGFIIIFFVIIIPIIPFTIKHQPHMWYFEGPVELLSLAVFAPPSSDKICEPKVLSAQADLAQRLAFDEHGRCQVGKGKDRTLQKSFLSLVVLTPPSLAVDTAFGGDGTRD